MIIATLLVACFACAYATDGKDDKGLSVTVIGETSIEKEVQAAIDSKMEWVNFGKDCKCEEKCYDRVKTICKATMVDGEEVCEVVETEVPIVKCTTKCITPEDGKTVLITLPSHHGRKMFTTGKDLSLVEKKDGDSKDAKICKETCEESTKKDKEKKCQPGPKVEKLDCKDKKDGQDCQKVCKCNGITTTTKKVPLFSISKGL